MIHNHLVVFVKEPRLGRVKRRLAAGIGPVAAWRFYRTTLTHLLRRLGRDGRWTLWLAVTPDRTTLARVWQIPGVQPRIISQGHGDLGQRMARSLRALPPGPVVIVGSDIPDLDRTHVAKAFRLLGQREFVFGPAMDGGYWLIGTRRRPCLPKRLFNGVRWSTQHALTDTWCTLPPGTTIGLLDPLEDVDDAEAFMRWRARTGPTGSSRRRSLRLRCRNRATPGIRAGNGSICLKRLLQNRGLKLRTRLEPPLLPVDIPTAA